MKYVSFELAKKLKEKGFPQGNREDFRNYYYKISDGLQMAIVASNGEEVEWYCPDISEVLKWLRETHNIHINIYFFKSNGNTELYWAYSVENIKDDFEYDWLYSTRHDTYEAAALAGIEYVLDNILI